PACSRTLSTMTEREPRRRCRRFFAAARAPRRLRPRTWECRLLAGASGFPGTREDSAPASCLKSMLFARNYLFETHSPCLLGFGMRKRTVLPVIVTTALAAAISAALIYRDSTYEVVRPRRGEITEAVY